MVDDDLRGRIGGENGQSLAARDGDGEQCGKEGEMRFEEGCCRLR